MTGRLVGALLVLALLGGGIGYAVAAGGPEEQAPGPVAFASPAPVPATDPSIPVEIFRQDPDDATLETAIALRSTTLVLLDENRKPTKYRLSLQVPQGWVQTTPTTRRWQFTVPGNDPMSYGMRVDILAGTGQSAPGARQSRESALRSALLQGSFSDLEITEDQSNGFTAQYVQNGFQRFSLERFYPGPDPNRVYASVAVYGRARDVTGLSDLIERVSIDLRPVQSP